MFLVNAVSRDVVLVAVFFEIEDDATVSVSFYTSPRIAVYRVRFLITIDDHRRMHMKLA